jgi:HK97 family phage major capsid protein
MTVSAQPKTIDQIGKLVHETRVLASKSATLSSEQKEQIKKMNDDIEKLEEKNQKITRNLLASRKEIEEIKDTVDGVKKQVHRLPVGGTVVSTEEKDVYMALLHKFAVHGKEAMNQDEVKDLLSGLGAVEKKYLRTDSNIDGGFLVYPEIDREILKKITEVSDIRSVARVKSVAAKELDVVIRQNLMEAYWVGEAQTNQRSNSQYGKNRIFTKDLSVDVLITVNELQDAAWDMEREINSDVAERFAQKEGQAFVIGSGPLQPEGLLSNPEVQVINSGVANSITADSLLEVVGQLKVGYKPIYVLNRKTLSFVRQLKDSIGQYLWVAGISQGYPAMINGFPYLNAIDMPDIGVDTTPVLFGDVYRGYTITDRWGLTLVRDPYTLASDRMVKFVFTRRVGGQVVLAEALKKIACAA